jgi:FkbM family methyltransferase
MSRLGAAKAAAKHLAISTGFYKPARALQRVVFPSRRREFRAHRLLLSEFIKPGELAFDVGAHVGYRTEILLSLGATVVSFEPQPICAREVAARGNKHLTVVNKAVGAAEGTAQLHLAETANIASLLPDWYKSEDDLGTITVPVTTLDKAIELFGCPSFCKVDVEGFEVEVLRGLSHVIPGMSIEYHADQRGIAKITECLAMLSTRAKYIVNLTGHDDAFFLLSSWLTIGEFKDSFPKCAKDHFFGDVFIRQC